MRNITTLILLASMLQMFGSSPADSLFSAGERAYRSADYQQAIALYTEVLQNEPAHLNAYLQRGFCYSLQKNYAAAVNDFSEVIKRRSDHLWAYTSRGSAYNKMEQYDKAMKDFNKVLSLDPKDEEAYNNRGWTKKFKGDLKGACKDWKYSKKLGNSEAKIIMKNNYCK